MKSGGITFFFNEEYGGITFYSRFGHSEDMEVKLEAEWIHELKLMGSTCKVLSTNSIYLKNYEFNLIFFEVIVDFHI